MTTTNPVTSTAPSVPTLTAPGADLIKPGTTPGVIGTPVPIGPIPGGTGNSSTDLQSLLPTLAMLGMGSRLFGGNAVPVGAYGVSPYGASPYGAMPAAPQQPGLLSRLPGAPQMNASNQQGISPSPNGLRQAVDNVNTYRSAQPVFGNGYGSPFSSLGSNLQGWNSLYSQPFDALPGTNSQSPWLNQYTAPLQGPLSAAPERTGLKAFVHKLFLGW